MKINEIVLGSVRGKVALIVGPQRPESTALALETALKIVNVESGAVLCVIYSHPPYAEPEAPGLVVLRRPTTRNLALYVERKIAEKVWLSFSVVIIERAWDRSRDEKEAVKELTHVAIRFDVAIVVLMPPRYELDIPVGTG